MLAMTLAILWIVFVSHSAAAQSQGEVSDEFYRRLIPSLNPSGIVERDKIKLVIDSAIERGLTDKPLDPDAVIDFSIVKQLRF
jgi:hypothetical protein